MDVEKGLCVAQWIFYRGPRKIYHMHEHTMTFISLHVSIFRMFFDVLSLPSGKTPSINLLGNGIEG